MFIWKWVAAAEETLPRYLDCDENRVRRVGWQGGGNSRGGDEIKRK